VSTNPIDTRAIAAQELADATVPTPEDALSDVGPFAQLLWIHDAAYVMLKLWGAILSDDAAGAPADADDVTEALTAISLACGNLDAACIAAGILDADAKPPETSS
jgi:hypothetical protein